MNKYLTVFSFSPVQSFIEASRKLKDLFTASYILSYLTKETAKDYQDSLVFPMEVKDDSNKANWPLANYPNRFVILTEEKVDCEKLKENFNNAWRGIWEKVLKYLKDKYENFPEDQFKLHVQNYFQTFCHCQEFIDRDKWKQLLDYKEDDNEDYGSNPYVYTYDIAERILGSKKSRRFYKPLFDKYKHGDHYPDGCTLCGERLHLALDWKELQNKLPKGYLAESEKLCGVCLVKRLAWDEVFSAKNQSEVNFPSVEEVAGIKFKKAFIDKLEKDEDLQKSIENIFELLPSKFKINTNPIFIKILEEDKNIPAIDKFASFVNIDSEVFRRFDDEFWLKELEEEYPEEIGKIKEAFNKLKQLFEREDLKGYRHRNAYYAILLADGDDMGRWLGPKKDFRGEELTDEFHKNFSKKLSDFAGSVIKDKKMPFLPVYAGGDDILAFLHPLDALDYAYEKVEEFKNTLWGKGSMSAGILITHVKSHLQMALKYVRDLEKKAKNFKRISQKGSLCIGILTHSGNFRSVVLNWEDLDTLKKLIEAFKSEDLSSNLAYTIREIKKLTDKNVIGSMLKRYFLRKSVNPESILSLHEQVFKNFFLDKHEFLASKALENLLDALYVARFLARNVEGFENVQGV
ncbi:type III-B CRISPR-associated protein Cas10/Cmr2 [Thermocrinis minervae]|uniref:CRISPR-associated protein Cmr2 n=1 Tax=Thermocrinis minervae TaxID=381751 RepID=A0A1M6QTT7_9AQUI|nr:type III-B CRISPR-associated protein Cas10/Cmr2 [Thermocrinis minervae]SHK23692.1 CRISPR-associated protein Cmr2 [Thermocrinis minervae]